MGTSELERILLQKVTTCHDISKELLLRLGQAILGGALRNDWRSKYILRRQRGILFSSLCYFMLGSLFGIPFNSRLCGRSERTMSILSAVGDA